MPTVSAVRVEQTFERVVILVIGLNAALLVANLLIDGHENLFETLDLVIVWFFVGETGVRIRQRVRAAGWRTLHRDRWLLFDVILVLVAIAPVGVNLTALRVVKTAKILHLGKHISHLRHALSLRAFGLLARRSVRRVIPAGSV